MPDLSTVDPVAIVLTHLRAHPAMLSAFGTADHISPLSESPWPHLRVTDGQGGDPRQMLWTAQYEVVLECYGAPANQSSEGLVRQLTTLAIIACKDLETKTYAATDPVVTRVDPSGVAINQAMPNGQYRFTSGVLLTVHPALQ